MSLLAMGSLGKASGLRGEIYLQAFNPESPHWRPGTEVYILPRDAKPPNANGIVDEGTAKRTRIEQVRHGAKGRLVVRFESVRDRTSAEGLRNRLIAISLDLLESPADDEFYYYEVVGWEVRDQTGLRIGNVVRAVETYMDLIEIQPVGGGDTFHIPVLDHTITRIDREDGVLHVALPEGLVP